VPLDKEIIVVDDGSTDGTRDILREEERRADLRVIFQPYNQGKGAALRTGMAHIAGDVVIIQDADLEYDPQDYLRLIEPISRGEAQVVYGVRDLGTQPWLLSWGNRFLTTATNLLYGTHLNDMETCYKMMTAEVARGLDIRANRFDIEPEITAKIAKRGYCIAQVPISYAPRRAKKLSPWRDGLPALLTLFKHRFTS
jgi:glycosyltransferase involved in cell wall biosynthesis